MCQRFHLTQLINKGLGKKLEKENIPRKIPTNQHLHTQIKDAKMNLQLDVKLIYWSIISGE